MSLFLPFLNCIFLKTNIFKDLEIIRDVHPEKQAPATKRRKPLLPAGTNKPGESQASYVSCSCGYHVNKLISSKAWWLPKKGVLKDYA